MRNSFVIASLLMLAACSTPQTVGSIAKGECQITHAPEYAVKGRTGYDQAWINRTTEALVDGCQQPRPKARPPKLDAPAAKGKAIAKAKPKAKPAKWRLPWPKPKPPEVES